MRRLPAAPAYALRVACLVTIVGALLAAGGFELGRQGYRHRLAAASVFVTGSVVQTDVGSDGDIRARWQDAAGTDHVQRFATYNDYRVGEDFLIRYDPAHPGARAYPGDPDESDGEDGFIVGELACAALGVLFLLGWGLRRWWWQRALLRPASEAEVLPLLGTYNGVASCWLEVRADQARRWQQVMWDPELDGLPSAFVTTVHGDFSRRRRVVVELPSGVPLVSQGRLRHKAPRSYQLSPRPDGVRSLEDDLVRPTGSTLPRPAARWRIPAAWGLGGLLMGAVLAVFTGGGVGLTLAFATGMATLFVNGWALGGGEQ